MIIKLTEINDAKLGSKAAKEIVGNKMEDGKEWRKKFFASDRNLRDQLDDVDVGEVINVILKQDGDFWNIKEIRQATSDEIEKSKKGAWKPAAQQGRVAQRADGGSRGDDTNRSAAIYLAREIYNMAGVEYKASPEHIACAVAELADKFIYPYIKDGAVPVMPESKLRKRSMKDALEPPTVED